ncbi:hypothetical protein [Streptomyces sp. NPDC007856]|uniref:hypothetical protein n=1 Tax=Streptomyces sp. NPDC007856 TaxID=3364781 RepID=UPI0036894890
MNALRLWRIRLHTLGSARLRMAMLFAGRAATTLTLLTSLPAQAAPSPSPSSTSSAPNTGGLSTPTPAEVEQAQKFMEEAQETLSKPTQQALLEAQADDLRKQLPNEGGVLGVFNVTDSHTLPISAYSVK